MSDLTEHMVERMRVEIAQSAAEDLLSAVGRLPDGPERQQAEYHIQKARSFVAKATEKRNQSAYGWIVHVRGAKGLTHVVMRNVGDSLTARDRALDALLDRGRIPSTTNVITETEEIRPGDICEYSPDEPVVYL